LLISACASPSTPSSTSIPTPARSSPVTSTPSASVPGAVGTPTPRVTATPQSALRDALAALHAEARDAQSAASVTEARQHAEAAVNILVGQWGRWYGDADGDGTVNDPLKGVGILPGERVPG